MNLHRLLQKRDSREAPGARRADRRGQVRLDVPVAGAAHAGHARPRRRGPRARARARRRSRRVGWEADALRRADRSTRRRRPAPPSSPTTRRRAIAHPATEVVIDATGQPRRGHRATCSRAASTGKHIVMVNVEADALAGPLLARARRRGGHRLFARLRRPAGADLRAGGLGAHRGLHRGRRGQGHQVPAGVPRLDAGDRVGPLRLQRRRWWPRATSTRRCSIPSSTAPRAGIEMAAVANATGLTPAPGRARVSALRRGRPAARAAAAARSAGSLHHAGQVEVISSVERDGRPVFRDLRWGVYVTFAAEHEYVRRCFQEYGIVTDPSGEYASMYKPSHLIGLELGISVASVALRGEATGCGHRLARRLRGHRQARAQGGRDARRRGRLHRVGQAHARRATPRQGAALPIGLAHKVKLKRDIAEGADRVLGRRGVRRERRGGADPPRDGASLWPRDRNTDEPDQVHSQ